MSHEDSSLEANPEDLDIYRDFVERTTSSKRLCQWTDLGQKLARSGAQYYFKKGKLFLNVNRGEKGKPGSIAFTLIVPVGENLVNAHYTLHKISSNMGSYYYKFGIGAVDGDYAAFEAGQQASWEKKFLRADTTVCTDRDEFISALKKGDALFIGDKKTCDKYLKALKSLGIIDKVYEVKERDDKYEISKPDVLSMEDLNRKAEQFLFHFGLADAMGKIKTVPHKMQKNRVNLGIAEPADGSDDDDEDEWQKDGSPDSEEESEEDELLDYAGAMPVTSMVFADDDKTVRILERLERKPKLELIFEGIPANKEAMRKLAEDKCGSRRCYENVNTYLNITLSRYQGPENAGKIDDFVDRCAKAINKFQREKNHPALNTFEVCCLMNTKNSLLRVKDLKKKELYYAKKN